MQQVESFNATTSNNSHNNICTQFHLSVSKKEGKKMQFYASKRDKSLCALELGASGLPACILVDFISGVGWGGGGCILLEGLPWLCERRYSLTPVDIS